MTNKFFKSQIQVLEEILNKSLISCKSYNIMLANTCDLAWYA